jgi:class 3 adenylate cyclase
MIERNAGVPVERRIELRVGVHLGDVVEESDGDLMGDGVNIATRLEGIAKPNAICLCEQAYWQVKGRLDLAVPVSARPSSRTSPSRSGSIRSTSASPRGRSSRRSRRLKNPPRRASRLSSCHSPISAAAPSRSLSSTELRKA